MIAVLWTEQARDDLARTYEFIGRDSLHHAGLVVRQLVGAVTRLSTFPESGRIVPELGRSDIREIIWHSYRLVYRYRPNAARCTS